MNLLDVQNQIMNLMARFYAQVKGATYIGRTDFDIVAETILIPLLSEVYGYTHLRNLNAEKPNFPGIDLADDFAKVAIQVTATPDSDKIQDTLQKFHDNKLHLKYDRLIIYILTERQKTYSEKPFSQIIRGEFLFDPVKDIIDYKNVLDEVKNFQIDKALLVLQILESNFSRGEVVLYHEEVDPRKEETYLNLIELTIPNELFIAQVEPDILKSISKKRDKRKALYDEIAANGHKSSSDWEFFEGKILTFLDLASMSIPISTIIDFGSLEVFNPEDFFTISEDYERVFKSLLRKCLQQKLYQRNVYWQYKEHLFIFGEEDNKPKRIEHWRGKVEDDRVVYERTMKNNKPDEILRCKHFAFKVEFKLIDKKWYLLIKPEWFFSADGSRKSVYGADDLDWLKRHEKNTNVFNHFRFIHYFLSEQPIDLFGKRKPYAYLSFGKSVKFDNASYLDDRAWLPVKIEGKQDGLINTGQLDLLEDL